MEDVFNVNIGTIICKMVKDDESSQCAIIEEQYQSIDHKLVAILE